MQRSIRLIYILLLGSSCAVTTGSFNEKSIGDDDAQARVLAIRNFYNGVAFFRLAHPSAYAPWRHDLILEMGTGEQATPPDVSEYDPLSHVASPLGGGKLEYLFDPLVETEPKWDYLAEDRPLNRAQRALLLLGLDRIAFEQLPFGESEAEELAQALDDPLNLSSVIAIRRAIHSLLTRGRSQRLPTMLRLKGWEPHPLSEPLSVAMQPQATAVTVTIGVHRSVAAAFEKANITIPTLRAAADAQSDQLPLLRWVIARFAVAQSHDSLARCTAEIARWSAPSGTPGAPDDIVGQRAGATAAEQLRDLVLGHLYDSVRLMKGGPQVLERHFGDGVDRNLAFTFDCLPAPSPSLNTDEAMHSILVQRPLPLVDTPQ